MKNKKLFSILLVMVMLITSFLSSSELALAAEMKGEGTKQSPYLIKSLKDLYDTKDNLIAHYKLVNDLDFENLSIEPIDSFMGILDGNGYVIKNVNIVGTENVGLFGTLTNATIKNLGIEVATIRSSAGTAGVLFGAATGSTFTNCYVREASVSGKRVIGGLGGEVSDCIIEKCYLTEGEVSGGPNIGGLFGSMTNCTMRESFYAGDVIGSGDSGGLVGICRGVENTLLNAFSTGTIDSETGHGGGILGFSLSDTIKINNCYTSMLITAGYNVDGIFVDTTTENTKNSYFDSTISGLTLPIIQARTTEQLYTKSNYVSWDFENIWTIDEGNDYPRLRFEAEIIKPEEPETLYNGLDMVLEVEEKLRLSIDEHLSENINMTWISSDEAVATVDINGIITALKSGETIITVKAKYGKYEDAINILVVDDADDYRLAVDLKIGESARATIDKNKHTTNVIWSVADEAVATVSSKGKITAQGRGLTIVNAVEEDSKEVGQVYVRVR